MDENQDDFLIEHGIATREELDALVEKNKLADQNARCIVCRKLIGSETFVKNYLNFYYHEKCLSVKNPLSREGK